MKFDDLSLGLILLAASAAIWMSAQQFSRLPNQSYGSETMPLVLSALALALGAYLAGRSIVSGTRIPRIARADWARDKVAVAAFATTLVLVVAYIALAGRFGFVPVALCIVLALMLVMRVRWWVAIVLSVLATLAIQQAFGRLLLVPLPRSGVLDALW